VPRSSRPPELRAPHRARHHDAAAVARQQVDAQAALVHQYEAQLRLDQAAIESAALQLRYAHIRADFAGRVGLRPVDPRRTVGAWPATHLSSPVS
jgi:multidrug efflux system membrane fusion protein